MSIKGQILRGTSFVSGASLLARIGTFLANLAIIRLLGRDLIGELGLIENWLSLATMFSLLGLSVGITKFVAQYWESDRHRVGGIAATSMLIAVLASTLVGSAVWAGLSMGILARGSVGQILQTYSLLFLCLIFVSTFKQMVTNVIYGLQNYQVLVGANIIVGALSFPISYYLVETHQLKGALEARLFLSCIETMWLTWAMAAALQKGNSKLSLKHCLRDGRELFLFGVPTFFGQLASNPVQPFVLTFLASQPGGISQVGLITIAQRLVSLANFIPGSMASTLTPILSTAWASGIRDRFRESIVLTIRMCWIASLPISVFFMAATPTLITRLYGKDFSEAWPVTFLLLLISLLDSLNEPTGRSFIASGRVWLSTSNNFIWLATFVPLAITVIPEYKAVGYSGAFLCSYLLFLGFQIWWIQRLFNVDIKSLYPIMGISIILITASGFVAVSHQFALALLLTALTCFIEMRYFLSVEERAAVSRRVVMGIDKIRAVVAPRKQDRKVKSEFK